MNAPSRQLYPDLLRSGAILRIVVFHFFSWPFLSYIPSLGVMFALGGWFMANSLDKKQFGEVILSRLGRLLPVWYGFALIMFIAGYIYSAGAGTELTMSTSWLFPYERLSWNLDNEYANGAIVVTWYISAYLWLLALTPFMLFIYRRLSWFAVFGFVGALIAYTHFLPYQDTILGETWYDVLCFSGCWALGFARADGKILALPKYISYLVMVVCAACAVMVSYDTGTLEGNPIGYSLMSFGIAFVLLSINPDLSKISNALKRIITTVNSNAVTVYLYHNTAINASFLVGGAIGAYNFNSQVGQISCFVISLILVYVFIRTVGRIETNRWFDRA